ncbi:MOSC domain-containing protein [Paraburkholderia sp. CNPSo 3157]|uniref:MOSC domain-containing protein n=1 Tax=Paraburkholderia franconis TaxID=2654983 RepID=A0A7X1NC84_9BURK|nr:MOSC domain-containing protein [Paraburkholderia franconis]MPW19255.1 MOSC domain-containing protein [Paraburkholderia franconis]
MFVDSLYRYPVKGLSAEHLGSVCLKEAQGFPFDRAYAITDGSFSFDPSDPKPEPKTKFLMLAKYERLAKLKTRFLEETSELEVTHESATSRFNLASDIGREEAASFVSAFLGASFPGKPKFVHAPGHQFTDVSVHSVALMRSISFINLATVRDLGARVGMELAPLRFRANVYFDGFPAWSEMEWLGRHIRIGDARLKIVRRTKRCAATSVNPATGERDVNLPIEIREYVNHGDLGVYAEVLQGCTIKPGDAIMLAEH